MTKGYELPVYRSLTEKMLLAGIPREIAILNSTFAMIFLFTLSNPWLLPLNLIFHIACTQIAKKDPEFFDCLRRHIKRKDYYHV